MSAIKPGDLVMVVRPTPCCKLSDSIGKVFVVAEMATILGVCRHCNAPAVETVAAPPNHQYAGFIVSRLKRIDPLPAEDDIEHAEELTA